MIIVFGAMYFHQVFNLSGEDAQPALSSLHSIAHRHITQPFGGAASNQAFCANRMGVKTAIVGSVADDFDGTRIVTRLKRFGVMTSGVAARDHTFRTDHITGAQTFIMSSDHSIDKAYTSYGVNSKTSDDQVPDELLNTKHMLLTQSELPNDSTDRLIQRAKASGMRTIHTNYEGLPSHNKNITAKPDILISGSAKAKTIQITDKSDSSVINFPHMSPYIFDSFCGTFTSAYYTFEDIQTATEFGSVAAGLTIRHKDMFAYYQHDINDVHDNTYGQNKQADQTPAE